MKKKNRGRNRCGYGVFLSMFFVDFKTLSPDTKSELLVAHAVREDDEIDLISIDSTLTPPDRVPPSVHEVIRLAARHWRLLPPSVTDAWNERAEILNSRPLSGKFIKIPKVIKVSSDVIKSMTLDWEEFTRQFTDSIRRNPKKGDSERRFKFGNKTVTLHNMTYKNTYLSFLLKLCLFGRDLSNFTENEMVFRKKKTTVVHIASKQRMCELFTLNKLCCVTKDVDNAEGTDVGSTYFCCGKVCIMRDGKELVGYILSESRLFWKVKLETNDMVLIRKVNFVTGKNTGSYFYETDDKRNRMRVTEYNPIRIKIYESGKITMILNRCLVDSDGNLIIHRRR